MTSAARIRAAALFACLCAATVARAESLFELTPPGEPLLALDAHAIALAGASEARWHLESGLPSNPAQLVAIDGVSFATVIQWRRGLRDLEGAGANWDETRQDFPAFQISAAFPRGIRFGAGYRADLRSRGAFSSTVPIDLEGNTDSYRLAFSQDGGLSRFPLSLAMPLGERTRLGIGLNLYRGNRNQEWLFDFPNASSGDPDQGYQDRRVRRQARWHGKGLALGLQSRPLGPRAAFSLRWEAGADLEGEARTETAGETDVELVALSGRMPSRWALGCAFELAKGGIASLQWEHEAWSDYEAPLPAATLQDVDRVALGLEWLLGGPSRPGHRRQPLPLRLGVRHGRWPAPDPVTGGEVMETTLGLGTGIDVQSGRGSLDLALFWQHLGVDGGAGERRFGLALSLRTSEHWSRRTQPY